MKKLDKIGWKKKKNILKFNLSCLLKQKKPTIFNIRICGNCLILNKKYLKFTDINKKCIFFKSFL